MKPTLLMNVCLPLLLLSSSSSSISTFISADSSSSSSFSPPSRPFNELSLYMEPSPVFYLPYLPDTGEYYITNELNPIDVRRLSYTKTDWTRFDSYTPAVSLYVKATDWTNTNRIRSINPEFISTWLSVYSANLDVNFYQIGYGWFRGFSKSNFDIYANLLSNNDFNVGNAINNASYAINQAINVWRNKNKVDGMQVDSLSLPDVKTLNTVPETLVWLELFITSQLQVQALEHKIVPRPGSPWPPYDEFGLFANQESLGVGISPSAHVFQVTPLGLILSHYVHLFTPSLLRRSRRAIMASYSALYFALTTQGGWGQQLSTAQWLDRVTGASLHVNYMLQTEKYMKQNNGGWSESVDGVSVTNIAEGRWTNADALDFLNKLMDTLVSRTYLYGFTEFNSIYYANDMDSLTIAMLHSPNQAVYEKWESVHKWLWWDIAANYHPSSGVLTGTIARTYDLYNGAHGGVDRQALRMYMLPFFKAYCRSVDSVTSSVTDACHPNTLGAQPPSGDFAMGPHQFMWAAWNAGGFGYLPMDVIVNITILMPYRTVEQRFDSVKGQERYNFIAPGFSMAHSGEETGFTTANVIASARVAGEPNRAYPISASRQQTHAVNLVRLMLENMDSPFGSIAGAAPGLNVQLIPRQLVSQYQSYMLITSLAVPGKRENYLPNDDGTASLNTNLLLPLHVDGLYADDIALPRAIGAAMILPHNAVLTVRHGSQTLAFRLLYSERSSTSSLVEASTISLYTGNSARIQPRAANLPYSYMWIVDAEGWAQGNGRIVVCHKRGNGVDTSAKGPYRVSWLWGAGETNTEEEVNAIRAVMREAKFTSTITPTPIAAQTVDMIGNRLPSTFWNTSVVVDSSLHLNVERTDTFQYWGNDPIWAKQGGSNLYPVYTLPFARRVNGSEILNFNTGDFAFRVRNETDNVYQPHRDWLRRKAQTPPVVVPPAVISVVDPSPSTPTIPSDFTAVTQVTPATVTTSSTTTAPTAGITIPTSFIIPTRIECELFTGWFDTSVENLGRGIVPNRGLYTSAPVDISASPLASYGYYISYIHEKEWLEYSISSLTTSHYSIAVRYAQIYQTVKAVTVMIDNVIVCTIPTQWTRGWELFQIASCITPTPVTAGLHTLRLTFPWRELNVDYTHWTQVSGPGNSSSPGTGAAVIPPILPQFEAIRASVHFNYPINQSQTDEFVHKFTTQMAQALGLEGDSTASRIIIVGVDSDDVTETQTSEQDETNTQTNSDMGQPIDVASTGSPMEATAPTAPTDTNVVVTDLRLDTGSGSGSDSSSSSTDSTVMNAGPSATAPVDATSAPAYAPAPVSASSRRLLQLSGYFDVDLAPLGNGINVAFIVLPSDMSSKSSHSDSATDPVSTTPATMSASEVELSSISAALSSSCTEPVVSLWRNSGSILSAYDCLNSPTIQRIQVKQCTDGSVSELCPERLAATGDSDVNTLAPPPDSNSYNSPPSSSSSDPMSISTRTLVIALVGAFVCSAIFVLLAYKLHKWWLNKGKVKFASNRRRASLDAASSEPQLQGVSTELAAYRSSYPPVPAQGTRGEQV